ncbi:MAG: hypothetical protein KDK04_21930 [Candidatus Competibacteraceae bacterium]|nr:hypothetical protein [Candidatus Competibacteraceae bacterium]
MSADAQKVGEELEALHEQKSGVVTSQDVVDTASDESSAMHPLFTWDDTEAAQKQRRSEAMFVMRNLVVVVKSTGSKDKVASKPIPVRAMINARTEQGRGYMPIAVGMADDKIRQQILKTALSDLNAWRRKYATLEELADVFTAIDELQPVIKEAA